MSPRPAVGISRRLHNAGYTRHVPGTPGYRVTGAGTGRAEVWDADQHGKRLPASPQLQAYGRTLAAWNYRVTVLDDENGVRLDVRT